MIDAKVVAECLFDLFSGEVRIAIFVEEDGFGGEELALAIGFDGSTFEDHSALEDLKLQGLGDA